MSPIPDERYSTASAGAAPVDETECVNRFWDRVRVFALRRTGDGIAADDIAQETLRRVLEALRAGRVENLVALPAFVFQTALHVCQHHNRSAGREGRALLRLHRGSDAAFGGADALHSLIGEERRAEMRRALDTLEPADRELVRMLYYEQMDSAEAARRLGITTGALRVRKHRVLERLARRLRPKPTEERNDAERSGT